jgi:hypothetical protein
MLFALMGVVGFMVAPNSPAIGAIATLSYLSTLCCHVSLVYLRSKSVFVNSGKYIRFMLISSSAVIFFLTLSGLTYIVYYSSMLDPVFSISSGFGLIGGVLLGCVDVISTFAFARKVAENSLKLKGSHMSPSLQVQEKQLLVIARRGFVICFLACITLVLMWASYSWLWWAIAAGEHAFQTFQWISWASSCLISTCMILWIWMKIEVDGLKSLSREPSKLNMNNTTQMV